MQPIASDQTVYLVDCPKCGGPGALKVETKDETIEIPCPVCKGRGTIREEK